MYDLTVEDLRMEWGELLVRDIHQANSVYNASECCLDILTGEQLQFLVDKHGHKQVIDRLSPLNRDEDEGNY